MLLAGWRKLSRIISIINLRTGESRTVGMRSQGRMSLTRLRYALISSYGEDTRAAR
jgi:hypothetical protein